jgi:hypothetical protein
MIRRRQRTPLLIATFFSGGALFIGLKYRTIMQRSEAAKKANAKEGVNYSVAPGRSGTFPFLLLDPRVLLNSTVLYRRRSLIDTRMQDMLWLREEVDNKLEDERLL